MAAVLARNRVSVNGAKKLFPFTSRSVLYRPFFYFKKLFYPFLVDGNLSFSSLTLFLFRALSASAERQNIPEVFSMIHSKLSSLDLSDESVITNDNIVSLGEALALCAIKFRISRTGCNLHRLYRSLIRDVFFGVRYNDSFSDGYDVAETAMLFLCEHTGKKLGDTIVNRFNKIVSVRRECYHVLDSFIFRNYIEPSKLFVSTESVLAENAVAPATDYIKNDFYVADNILNRLNLTSGETEVIECFMSGLPVNEIAAVLGVNRFTVWKRRQRALKKYIAAFG